MTIREYRSEFLWVMKRSACLAIVLLWSVLLVGPGPAFARERGAFEQHLRDAIRLNQARRPLYSAVSKGASVSISDRLIRDERLVLPIAMAVDLAARWWQKRGVPIVAEDFVSMELAPAFEPEEAHSQPLSDYRRQDGWDMARRLRQAGKTGGFDGTCRAVRAELERLEPVPAYHAMVRHVLQSTLRVAALAPKHEALARAKGLPSTAGLSRRLISMNLLALIDAAALDERAAPLQAVGIPIVHRDVPPIDTHSEFYDGPRPAKAP